MIFPCGRLKAWEYVQARLAASADGCWKMKASASSQGMQWITVLHVTLCISRQERALPTHSLNLLVPKALNSTAQVNRLETPAENEQLGCCGLDRMRIRPDSLCAQRKKGIVHACSFKLGTVLVHLFLRDEVQGAVAFVLMVQTVEAN